MHREALLALVVLAGCPRSSEVEPPLGPKRVRCEPVRVMSSREIIEVRGTIAPLPDRDAQIAPQVSGRLLRVEVREGDPVDAGQIVARVDDAALVDATQQADAALARARAERLNAQTTLERVERVFERGIAAKQEVDDASAKAASARAAEAETEASARVAHRQVDRAVVRSPLSGVVLRVLKKPGELVDGTPATPALEVADLSVLELVADVPAQDLVRLARGAAAGIVISALPGRTFTGEVSRVSPAVDRVTGVGAVRIRVAPSGGIVPPVGVFGVARVETGEPRQVALVPTVALRARLGAEAELVICGGDHVAHVRRVQPGTVRDVSVEVIGELTEKDAVAVEPIGLSEGDVLEGAP